VIATDHVVVTYQLLQEQDGKAPSDARLGEALGVSRSRAQQLRTQAINDGHPELAKPLRIAS
jgi:biotin operon repressor